MSEDALMKEPYSNALVLRSRPEAGVSKDESEMAGVSPRERRA
jgi:hypothetical protein